MRLAEEEKLRKEMSAKKAKEEAERKHQVSPALRRPFRPTASAGPGCPLCALLPPARVLWANPAQHGGGRPWLPSIRLRTLRGNFHSWETAPR